jgi:glyoxylase-like metal-dependent hydrolase (beta-lactamase superfamily II)/8-oxo-dGTP pyrophosphatase MutT (NUDIX family)
VLLGRRARRARFMPGNLVFPGGRLDPADEPGHPGALSRCASREVHEEAGIAIAPHAWLDAGERTTPPMFPVRFKTRFFVAELPGSAELPAAPPAPEEIESLAFEDPHAMLEAWTAGSRLVPPPLLPILRLMVENPTVEAAALASSIAAVNAQEDPIPRIEFVPGIWVHPVKTRTLPPACCTNVWMPGGRRFVVIDPGSDDPEENARLLAIITRRVEQGDAVEAIVLTHHHRDHVAGASTIAVALGVPVLAHEETFARIPKLDPRIATRDLRDGEALDLDGMVLRAVHTPGHAPGHLAFFDDVRRVLIAGDLVSGLSTILVGLSDGDMDAYLAALERARRLEPAVVLPSHGPPLPGASLAVTIAHRESREAAIIAAVADGALHSLAMIAAAAYADTPDAPPFLRELQTRAHLARLVGRGRVQRVGDGYRSMKR